MSFYARNTTTADGISDLVSVPFPFLSRDHVSIKVDGSTASFTWNSDSVAKLDTLPTAGQTITIQRATPIENPIVDYEDGSTLSESQLDASSMQTLFVTQEAFDEVAGAIRQDETGVWDALNVRLTNVADPVDAQDAVTYSFLGANYPAVATVAGIAGNVTAVAGNATNITTVANNVADIDAVATSIGNVNAVAADLVSITAVNDNKTNIDAVAGNASNINTVAGDSANISVVVTNIADVNAVAGDLVDINSVAGSLADIGTVAVNISDVQTVAANIGLLGIKANVDATNITGSVWVTALGLDNAAKTDVLQVWQKPQKSPWVTDNDGNFDCTAGQNFKCTPGGAVALTFSNIQDGMSGEIWLVNSGGETISEGATPIKHPADLFTAITTAGEYHLGWRTDGTTVRLTYSEALV